MSDFGDDVTLYNSKKELTVLDATKPDMVTTWRPIFIAGVTFFLVGIENALTTLSEYPYMHEIDKDATFEFFSMATSISNWGHAMFSIIFSFWNYRYQTVKRPLIVGRVIATLGTVLYICVELFPTNRRYVMLVCYILFAIAASSAVVLRSYIIFHSSEVDRARACAVLPLANVMCFIAGPLIQLAFSGIDYPGLTIVKGIYFNLFSAPIWISIILNIITALLIIFILKEVHTEELSERTKISLNYMKETWRKIKFLEVSWIFVIIVLFERLIINTVLTTLGNVISPMMISVWGMTNSQIVKIVSISMAIVGVLAIITAGSFMATPLSRILSSRLLFLISFITALVMYILAFPYPFSDSDIPAYNETSGVGCNPEEYNWCDTARAENIWVWLSVVLIAMGVALPTAQISIDSIYSKVVGEANQSIMQGLVMVVDDIVNIAGPLYVGLTFTKGGPTIFWIVNGCLTIFGTIIWAVIFRWMKPY